MLDDKRANNLFITQHLFKLIFNFTITNCKTSTAVLLYRAKQNHVPDEARLCIIMRTIKRVPLFMAQLLNICFVSSLFLLLSHYLRVFDLRAIEFVWGMYLRCLLFFANRQTRGSIKRGSNSMNERTSAGRCHSSVCHFQYPLQISRTAEEKCPV